jgi:hypothetical protein
MPASWNRLEAGYCPPLSFFCYQTFLLPLPLGEVWGEGLARTQKKEIVFVVGRGYQLRKEKKT